MGVWIEIVRYSVIAFVTTVTPFVGVWIEIEFCSAVCDAGVVTPLVGVWIEIEGQLACRPKDICHSPCGSVD